MSDPQNGTASIIMCDIDFFKKVNDTYGHNAGDAVLQRIAAVLQEHVASEDEAVRWGGRRIYPDVYGLPACQSTGDCRTYSRDRRAYVDRI